MTFPRLSATYAATLALLLVASPAVQAQPLTATEAALILYPADRVEIVRHATPGLSDAQVQTLITVAQTQRYYAALAFAPDAGIMAEPTMLAANYHNPEAARGAALRECDARRSGGARCTLALEVRPAGWQARPLSLSADASEAFDRDYRRARGSRAFAISESSGAWAIARGDAAEAQALAACQADAGGAPCIVALRD